MLSEILGASSDIPQVSSCESLGQFFNSCPLIKYPVHRMSSSTKSFGHAHCSKQRKEKSCCENVKRCSACSTQKCEQESLRAALLWYESKSTHATLIALQLAFPKSLHRIASSSFKRGVFFLSAKNRQKKSEKPHVREISDERRPRGLKNF